MQTMTRLQELTNLLANVLGRNDQTTLHKAIRTNGCGGLPDLLSMSTATIDTLQDVTDVANPVDVQPADKNLIRVLHAWNHYLKWQLVDDAISSGNPVPARPVVNWQDASITQDEFDRFRVSAYDPTVDMRSVFPLRTTTVPPAPTRAASAATGGC